jgi:hypothetical protein
MDPLSENGRGFYNLNHVQLSSMSRDAVCCPRGILFAGTVPDSLAVCKLRQQNTIEASRPYTWCYETMAVWCGGYHMPSCSLVDFHISVWLTAWEFVPFSLLDIYASTLGWEPAFWCPPCIQDNALNVETFLYGSSRQISSSSGNEEKPNSLRILYEF